MILIGFQVAIGDSVAGSGPGTGLGPAQGPGLIVVGQDRDRKNFGPVPGPGPGPQPMGRREGPVEDRSGPVLPYLEGLGEDQSADRSNYVISVL